MEPSPEDYLKYEKKWLDDYRYFMGINIHREVSSFDAAKHFIEDSCYDGFSMEEKCRIAYTYERIIPALLNGKAPERYLGWIYSRLEDFCTLLNKHSLLKQQIAA